MMYTLIPNRSHREVSRPMMNSLFDDRFFRSFFDLGDMIGSTGFRVDVRETPEAYLMEAELPGVKQEQITLTLDHDVLTIAADVNTGKQEERGAYICSERRSGHMSRAFNVEGVDQENITAEYQDGVLHIRLPRPQPAPEKTARTIAIGNGNA